MRWKKFSGSVCGWILVTSMAAVAGGQKPSPDKSAYTLFRPAPRELMRDMSADRPNKTEGPVTVDAGHLQLEMDLVTYTTDRTRSSGGHARTQAWSAVPLNLRLGLLDNLEFDLILETCNWTETEETRNGYARLQSSGQFFDLTATAGDRTAAIGDRLQSTRDFVKALRDGGLKRRIRSRQSGYGDTTLRLKYNFLGNEGGKFALGLIPFVKFPTNQDGLGNDSVEGGVILPVIVQLPADWECDIMTEIDVLRDETGSGHHPLFINSVSFGHKLVGDLDGYAEIYTELSGEQDARWLGTLDFGLTYAASKNVILDTGINIGITDNADDVNVFAGLSWRY